ncbi:hypothetical protein WR25_03175 [Diploscapter pachys]|uniref:Uncharacterized protein n=1 Tax=Diploscapter pachys TaxID=2018661 RepID=A0A2A2L825_9BILA|nr:hypothetical protein WR25_03175 [Diploscapter pachys]
MCRQIGEKWTDDDTWVYQCNDRGTDAPLVACKTKTGDEVPIGQNRTINALWYSCKGDDFKVKYEEEPHCTMNDTNGKAEGIQRIGQNQREGRFDWLCLETGRWVVGCYYKNETNHDVYLKIGETGYNGLVKHVCDRYKDYPGLVQYYAQIREDAHVKQPANKGKNENLPEPGEEKIGKKIERWLHETANNFIKNGEVRVKVRYLPKSRRAWEARTPSY